MSATWRLDAACADSGEPELFDPIGEYEPVEFMMRRAKSAVARYCAACPVAGACHQEAEVHEYLGVWGGKLRERRHVRDLLAMITPSARR